MDVAHVISGARPRTPLSTIGTLKIEPSFIPGVDFRLNKVLKKYGGWNCVMTAAFELSAAFYEELLAAGYDRPRFDRSRAYIINPTVYTHDALEANKKSESN